MVKLFFFDFRGGEIIIFSWLVTYACWMYSHVDDNKYGVTTLSHWAMPDTLKIDKSDACSRDVAVFFTANPLARFRRLWPEALHHSCFPWCPLSHVPTTAPIHTECPLMLLKNGDGEMSHAKRVIDREIWRMCTGCCSALQSKPVRFFSPISRGCAPRLFSLRSFSLVPTTALMHIECPLMFVEMCQSILPMIFSFKCANYRIWCK